MAIEQRLVTFPNIAELIEELGCFNYDVTDFGNIRYSAPQGMHDDCVISLALAVMGMKSFIYGKKPRIIKYKYKPEPANAGIGY